MDTRPEVLACQFVLTQTQMRYPAVSRVNG
jgi:hypothetical protein